MAGLPGLRPRLKEAILRYLCLLIAEPEPGVEIPVPGSAEFARMLAEFQSATAAMADSGVLVDSGPLQPPAAASMLRVRNGKTLVTGGPFAATRETIGGYHVLDCADLDEAIRWAATIPSARYGAIELRPLMVMPGHE
jgi:hypothetical protein